MQTHYQSRNKINQNGFSERTEDIWRVMTIIVTSWSMSTPAKRRMPVQIEIPMPEADHRIADVKIKKNTTAWTKTRKSTAKTVSKTPWHSTGVSCRICVTSWQTGTRKLSRVSHNNRITVITFYTALHIHHLLTISNLMTTNLPNSSPYIPLTGSSSRRTGRRYGYRRR